MGDVLETHNSEQTRDGRVPPCPSSLSRIRGLRTWFEGQVRTLSIKAMAWTVAEMLTSDSLFIKSWQDNMSAGAGMRLGQKKECLACPIYQRAVQGVELPIEDKRYLISMAIAWCAKGG